MRTALSEAEASFVRWERVARFATVDADGAPHVVPICPALDGDAIVFASEATAKLQHLRADPRCAVIFDSYVEDWNLNHQVQVLGVAAVLVAGPAWERGKALLDEKFRQYQPLYPIVAGQTSIVRVEVGRVTSEGF